MKKKNNYREVATLPKSALTVAEYAGVRDCKHPYLYELWGQHITDGKKINFEIIRFKGHNYVIPKKTRV